MLKNAKKIYEIGRWVMVVGSVLYLAQLLTEMLTQKSFDVEIPIIVLYSISVILLLIGWIGTKDERKEEKARLKAEKNA